MKLSVNYLNSSHPVWTVIACNFLETSFHSLVLKKKQISSYFSGNQLTDVATKVKAVKNLQKCHASDEVSNQYEVAGGLGVQGDDVVEVAALKPQLLLLQPSKVMKKKTHFMPESTPRA